MLVVSRYPEELIFEQSQRFLAEGEYGRALFNHNLRIHTPYPWAWKIFVYKHLAALGRLQFTQIPEKLSSHRQILVF